MLFPAIGEPGASQGTTQSVKGEPGASQRTTRSVEGEPGAGKRTTRHLRARTPGGRGTGPEFAACDVCCCNFLFHLFLGPWVQCLLAVVAASRSAGVGERGVAR